VPVLLAQILNAKNDAERLPAITELKMMGEKSLQPLLWEAFHEQGDPTREPINIYIIRMAVWCGCALHPSAFQEFYRTNYRTGLSPDLDRMRKMEMADGMSGQTMIHRLISPLSKYNSDKKTFAEDCLYCDWVEIEDSRRWKDFPELKEIYDLGNSDRSPQALPKIASVWSQFKDYYFVYMWKMILLADAERKSEAENVFAEGLSNSLEKYYLCSNWAKIAYNSGNLEEAVRWWIRSIVSEFTIRKPKSEDAFLYLAYVAKFLGDQDSEKKLFAVVDRLTIRGRYNEKEQARISSLVSSQGTPMIKEAIKLLCSKYLQ
jgi:hypothetical protein